MHINTIACLTACMSAVLAHAAHVHFDVSPYRSGNTLVTGGVTHLAAANPWTGLPAAPHNYAQPNQRVFEYEFGEDPAFPLEVGDPGVNREPGTYTLESGCIEAITGSGLPMASTLSLVIRADLKY